MNANLLLPINGKRYTVRIIKPSPVIELTAENGERIECGIDDRGGYCTCQMRRSRVRCPHWFRLKDVGLIGSCEARK